MCIEPIDLEIYDELIKEREKALEQFADKAEAAKINFKLRVQDATYKAKGLKKNGNNKGIGNGFDYFTVKDLEEPLAAICKECSILYQVGALEKENGRIGITAWIEDCYSDNKTNNVTLSVKDPEAFMEETLKIVAEKLPATNSYGKAMNPESIYGGDVSGTACKRTGAILTYLRRYVKMLVFGVSDEDELEADPRVKISYNEDNNAQTVKQINNNKPMPKPVENNPAPVDAAKEQCAAKAADILKAKPALVEVSKPTIRNGSKNPCSPEVFKEASRLWEKCKNMKGFTELQQAQFVKDCKYYVFKDTVDRLIAKLKLFCGETQNAIEEEELF